MWPLESCHRGHSVRPYLHRMQSHPWCLRFHDMDCQSHWHHDGHGWEPPGPEIAACCSQSLQTDTQTGTQTNSQNSSVFSIGTLLHVFSSLCNTTDWLYPMSMIRLPISASRNLCFTYTKPALCHRSVKGQCYGHSASMVWVQNASLWSHNLQQAQCIVSQHCKALELPRMLCYAELTSLCLALSLIQRRLSPYCCLTASGTVQYQVKHWLLL